MTSSLVGSEMCIRDRQKAVINTWNAWQVPFAKAETCTKAINKMQGAVAVSYTHLTLPTICSV
eukprot:610511-Prorocentrum_lima.AAC.1